MSCNLTKKFDEIGARTKIDRSKNSMAIDIGRDKLGEYFYIKIPENINMEVLNVDRDDRHLILLAYEEDTDGIKIDPHRFLCGHDERQWFVSAVPGRITTVKQAKEALKPKAVVEEQNRKKVKAKDRNKKKNEGFIRQGEWFFIPRPNVEVDERLILKNEPLIRGNGGTPHYMEECYRCGGETVYVHIWAAPDGLTQKQYKEYLKQDKAYKTGWQTMKRNPTVYARGTIKQPDPQKRRATHATIYLPFWHKVEMAEEEVVDTMGKVRVRTFLD